MADQIECQGVWKIYGKRATESLTIIEQCGLTKDDARQGPLVQIQPRPPFSTDFRPFSLASFCSEFVVC